MHGDEYQEKKPLPSLPADGHGPGSFDEKAGFQGSVVDIRADGELEEGDGLPGSVESRLR